MLSHYLFQHKYKTVCAISLAFLASVSHAQTAVSTSGGSQGTAASSSANTRVQSTSEGSQANTVSESAEKSTGAQSEGSQGNSASGSAESKTQASGQGNTKETQDTQQQINSAVEVVKQMESDPQLQKLMKQAQGIFIVPNYGRAALGVGARAGEGILLTNKNGKWGNPAFYNIGGISFGAQAGGEIGSIAMLLMNKKAVNKFTEQNNFSLTADAGLTIANYTAKTRESVGRGDIIVWSDTKGAFASAAIGVTDIHFDDDDNSSFYNKKVTAQEIIQGKVQSAKAKSLTKELSSGQ